MASSWRIGKRGFRPKVSTAPEDYYRMDLKKSPQENALDIFLTLCAREVTESKRLSLLNAFATLFQQNRDINLGFSTEEFLYCISASLVHTFTQVRAAALRAIRYLIVTAKDIQIFNSLQLQYLVCRSIDVLLKNEDERVQALKLIRKMLAVAPEAISPILVRCLVSLGESGIEDGDRMLRACLATLCEFGVLNPTLLIVCGGVNAITHNVLECHSPRIAESLVGVLLHLLEWPQTRNIAGVRLDCLAAPYCDFTYRLGIMDKNKDARELRYTSSRLALLSVLRSWAGILEFCDPNKPSGLKAIVDILYLNQLEVRKAILDLFYELLGLPQPIWTDEYSVALSAVDPSDFQDSWLLTNGFVAAEGRSILPSLASRVPNACEQHTALLLYCFLEAGLLNALAEVIVSSDTFISVRATVLLAKFLHLMHTHLPADICSVSSALPILVSHAAKGSQQATAAISALQSYHQMLKNRPASCSLFLDNLIQSGSLVNTKIFKREINTQENLNLLPPLLGTLERKRHDSVSSSISGGDEPSSSSIPKRASIRLKRKKFTQFFENWKELDRLIKDSNVLTQADGNAWDWDIIISILRSDAIGKLDDLRIRFLRRIVHYFKPSSNRFSHQDLYHGRNVPSCVIAGLDLIDWLLQSQDLESMRLLTDLFSDISQQLLAITTSSRAHDCLFSPQHMSSTMCQQYFLFIGRMCRTEKGVGVLTNTDVFKQLINLVMNTDHVCYVKLIVSGLDYSLESYPRKILEKALTSSKTRSGRLYATQFTLVLLRVRIPNFEVWGIPMLVNQCKDTERCVVLAAMEVLDEACHDRTYLEEIVSIWPNFKEVGDVGKLLMSRYYSIPRGLNHQNATAVDEIEIWKNFYNKRYVLLVEADTHSSLTLHTKNEDGLYSRRNCSSRPTIIPPNLPSHLYGQLTQTDKGLKELKKYGDIPQLIEILTLAKCTDENESLDLKAALWALGHTATSANGVEFLSDPAVRLYEKIIYLVKYCEVYSIRGTAFNVLGLIGSTNAGANILFKLDWFCVRHDRNTIWPVCEPEDWFSSNPTPVRHQYEEVPPYNYTGIDENINGFNTSSESNSFYFDENGESKASSKDESDGQIGAALRSRTLPESTTTRFIKHTRSLSESKTTDVISLISGGQHHRTRFNSGTDSNTSGVSSCESVFGRNIVGELQQTPLSPIPSTSNLLELPIRKGGPFRRISLVGTSIRENSISPQDIQGYATLRSLRRHCRPVLSESAADELAEIIDRDSANTVLRPRKHSISESQRKVKVRSLDRHSTQLIPYEEFQVPLPTLATPKFLPHNDSKGPCYSGICLPKNLLDLFPSRNLARTYVSRDIQDLDVMDFNLLTTKQQFLNDSLNEGDESSVSSLSDVSSISKRTKWVGKHNRANCLHCSRSRVNRLQPKTDSDINIFKRKSNYSSSVQLSDTSFSPESILSDESTQDRITANILHHVQRMSNPVCSKQSKVALLELKQKHPTSFQDICLYSEVCKALGRNTYRMNARRFLQELFLDLNFDSFYAEPNEILCRKEKDITTTTTISICLNNSEDENSMTTREYLVNAAMSVADAISAVAAVQQQQQQQQLPTNNNYSTALKTQLKSPALASVYETSYENLSDSFNNLKITNKTLATSSSNSYSSTSQKQIVETTTTTTPAPTATTMMTMSNVVDCLDGIKPIENENKKYTRGRFYTLELDLSCTKNKFPITNRKKKGFSPTTTPTTILGTTTITTTAGAAIGTVDAIGQATTATTTTACYPQIVFTKSLSSSVAAPVGSLFCEKRLQSSKSEAVLSKTKQN